MTENRTGATLAPYSLATTATRLSISSCGGFTPMSIRLGIVMDPIASIAFKKDSSLAMLLAAQARGWSLF